MLTETFPAGKFLQVRQRPEVAVPAPYEHRGRDLSGHIIVKDDSIVVRRFMGRILSAFMMGALLHAPGKGLGKKAELLGLVGLTFEVEVPAVPVAINDRRRIVLEV